MGGIILQIKVNARETELKIGNIVISK